MTMLDISAADALARRLRGRPDHARPPGVRRPATHLERRDRPPPGASSPAARGPATSPRRCAGRATAGCPWPYGAAATASPDTRSSTTASCSTCPACAAPSSIRRRRTVAAQGGASTPTSTGRARPSGWPMTSGYISHTGIAGLTLGGGIGHLMRKIGPGDRRAEVVPGRGRRRLDRARPRRPRTPTCSGGCAGAAATSASSPTSPSSCSRSARRSWPAWSRGRPTRRRRCSPSCATSSPTHPTRSA